MQICLIYASTSGNVEVTMEFVAKTLNYMGFESILNRAEKTSIETIKKHQKLVFGTSTWEHGVLNPFFNKLFEAMHNQDLSTKQAAFVGLGDRRYEPVFFCQGVEQLREVWLKNGGLQVNTTLKIQGEPYGQLNSIVAPWANTLAKIWTKSP